MFEENAQFQSRVAALLERLKATARGETLLWADIDSVLGIDHTTDEGRRAVRKARIRLLNQTGIATWKKYCVGVRVLTPSQQNQVCSEERQRSVHRQCNRGLKELCAIRAGDLTLHERTLLSSAKHTLRQARRQARLGVKTAVSRISQPTEVLPLRKLISCG